MRDLLSIRQTNDVLEYAGRFEKAKHRVLVHNKETGEVFFVQKFLDGLKYNISNAIILHKPRTVDAALSLALMQEELLATTTRRFSSRAREYRRSAIKTTTSNTQTNTPTSGVLGAAPTTEKPQVDKYQNKNRCDNKYETLRAKRRASGLCMKCGETYSPQHRCPKQVGLHVVEELMELLQHEEHNDMTVDTASQDSDEDLLSLP